VHGFAGDVRMRHLWELPLLIIGAFFTLLMYIDWIGLLTYAIVLLTSGRVSAVEDAIGEASLGRSWSS